MPAKPVSPPLADELFALVTELDPNFNARTKTNVAMGARFSKLYQALSRVDDQKNLTFRPRRN